MSFYDKPLRFGSSTKLKRNHFIQEMDFIPGKDAKNVTVQVHAEGSSPNSLDMNSNATWSGHPLSPK
jgi:hypothetical protein